VPRIPTLTLGGASFCKRFVRFGVCVGLHAWGTYYMCHCRRCWSRSMIHSNYIICLPHWCVAGGRGGRPLCVLLFLPVLLAAGGVRARTASFCAWWDIRVLLSGLCAGCTLGIPWVVACRSFDYSKVAEGCQVGCLSFED
jgi:hypothetical protein